MKISIIIFFGDVDNKFTTNITNSDSSNLWNCDFSFDCYSKLNFKKKRKVNSLASWYCTDIYLLKETHDLVSCFFHWILQSLLTWEFSLNRNYEDFKESFYHQAQTVLKLLYLKRCEVHQILFEGFALNSRECEIKKVKE